MSKPGVMKDPSYLSPEQVKRALILLRAAAAIVSKSPDAQETTAIWDGTDCDGACLMDDIAVFFEEVTR